MDTAKQPDDPRDIASFAPPADEAAESPPAWEQIANGRYMPRRVRGSCLGRELGWTFILSSGSDGQLSR